MVKDWLSLIPKKAPDARVIVHPGNDDKFVLDDVLRNSPNIVFAEEAVVHLDDLHEAACVGWSNQPLGTAHASAPKNSFWRS